MLNTISDFLNKALSLYHLKKRQKKLQLFSTRGGASGKWPVHGANQDDPLARALKETSKWDVSSSYKKSLDSHRPGAFFPELRGTLSENSSPPYARPMIFFLRSYTRRGVFSYRRALDILITSPLLRGTNLSSSTPLYIRTSERCLFLMCGKSLFIIV